MDKIFALDIGTRKVVGLLAGGEQENLTIIDCEIREHKTRAMLAGQIHEIEQVAQIVMDIKRTLQERTGETLSKAAVAVAGRSLKTCYGVAVKEVPFDKEIMAADILDLELTAVQKVLTSLHEQNMKNIADDYYCVGYSVINYYLDQEKIKNLVGQKARQIKVDIIATFLPRVVLESMFTVLKKAELEIAALTLEPIAAIRAIIPPDMQRLNLALVDIGAGTSDIAVTDGGSVIGYGMVPIAGDSITEKLCEAYLLDFYAGEEIKRKLTTTETVEVTDIFGKIWTVTSGQILKDIEPAVETLAKAIGETMISLNKGVSPSAVICVGGGSLTPFIQEKIAGVLQLSRERVGIRGPELIKEIHNPTGKLTGPEAITPLGIMRMARENQGLQFIVVTVNGKKIPLLNINQRLTVLSALIAGGANPKNFHPKPGLAKTFEINGELRVIPGTLGKAATILVNDQIASIEQMLSDKDVIVFQEAAHGTDGEATIGSILSLYRGKKIVLNGKETFLGPHVYMNGEPVTLETPIVDLAKVVIKPELTLRELLQKHFFGEYTEGASISVIINSEQQILRQKNFDLLINGVTASLDSPLHEGDIIEYKSVKDQNYQVRDVLPMVPRGRGFTVRVNGQEYLIEGQQGKLLLNGQEASLDDVIRNGADIRTMPGKDAELIMVDLLRYVPLNVEQNPNKKLKMLLNGKEAQFATVLSQEADVQIYFE